MSTHYFRPTTLRFRRHRWEAISPIAIDVTVPWSVCLSRSSIVLKQQKKSTRFLLHLHQPYVSWDRVNIWLTSVNPFLPNCCLCWFERRRYRKPSLLFRMVPSLTPTIPPFLPNGVPKCTPRDQLAGEYDRRCRSAMLPFVKLLWPLFTLLSLRSNAVCNTSYFQFSNL